MLSYREPSQSLVVLSPVKGGDTETPLSYRELANKVAFLEKSIAKQDAYIKLLESKDDTAYLKKQLYATSIQLEIVTEDLDVVENSLKNSNFKGAQIAASALNNLYLVRETRKNPGEPVKALTPTILNKINPALKINTNVDTLKQIYSCPEYGITTDKEKDRHGNPIKRVHLVKGCDFASIAPAIKPVASGGNKRQFCKNHPDSQMVFHHEKTVQAIETRQIYVCPIKGCTHTEEKRTQSITEFLREDEGGAYMIDSTTGEKIYSPGEGARDHNYEDRLDFSNESATNRTLAEKYGPRWYALDNDERSKIIFDLTYADSTDHETILTKLSDLVRGELSDDLPIDHQNGDLLVRSYVDHQNGDLYGESEYQIGGDFARGRGRAIIAPLDTCEVTQLATIAPLSDIYPSHATDEVDAKVKSSIALHGDDRAAIWYALEDLPPEYWERYKQLATAPGRTEVQS